MALAGIFMLVSFVGMVLVAGQSGLEQDAFNG